MIDEYYMRLATINSSPDVIKAMNDEDKTRLKSALENVQSKLDESDEEIKNAIEDFITVFNDLKLEVNMADEAKTRSIMPKTETSLPRQILNDVTIMTLNIL